MFSEFENFGYHSTKADKTLNDFIEWFLFWIILLSISARLNNFCNSFLLHSISFGLKSLREKNYFEKHDLILSLDLKASQTSHLLILLFSLVFFKFWFLFLVCMNLCKHVFV